MEQFLQFEEGIFDQVSDAILDVMERVQKSIQSASEVAAGPNSFFEWLSAAKEISTSGRRRAIVTVIFVRDTIFTDTISVKETTHNIILVSVNSEAHWQSVVQSFASTRVLFTCAFFSEKFYVDADSKTFEITIYRRGIE